MDRRYFILFILLFGLFGCKVDNLENEGGDETEDTFRIEVQLPNFKAVYEPPYAMEWNESDAISVLVKDGNSYSGYKFTKSEGDNNWFETGKFHPEQGRSYEIYVVYPYDANISGIDKEGFYTSPLDIPVSSGKHMVQNGTGNPDMVNVPMYGKAEIGAEGEAVVKLSHLTAMLAVTVRNEADIPINVNSLSLAGNEGIILSGEFFVNANDGSLKSPGSGYVSSETVLDVENGIVASKEEGTFYIPCPPFAISEGNHVTVSLDAEEADVKVEIPSEPASVEYAAGSYSSIGVTVTQAHTDAMDVQAEMARLYDGLLVEDFEFCSEGNPNARLEYFTGYAAARQKEDDFASSGKYINGHMGGDWIDYDIVRASNSFIHEIDTQTGVLSQEEIEGYKAEARVIRAWYYYTMAVRYGGMPIITDPEGPADVARSSEQEIWDFIISEIDAAIEGGLAEDAAAGRFGRYAALALKARAAIYAASVAKYGNSDHTDNNTGKQVCGIPSSESERYYRTALEAASEIISSGKFSLARDLAENPSDSYARLFLVPGEHNEDILVKDCGTHSWDYFHLPDPLFDRVLGEPRYDNPSLQLVNMYDKLDGTSAPIDLELDWSPEQPSDDTWFVDRDYRFAGTIYYPGCPFPVEDGKLQIVRGLIGPDGWVGVEPGWVTLNGNLYYSRGTYGMGDETDTPTGFMCRKYVDESRFASVAQNTSTQQWIAIRYAEILLIAAEAAAELGTDNGSGLAAINDIRSRAGLPEAASLTVDEVRKQWVCEMAFENRIFWCMRRWRTLEQSLSGGYMPRGLAPYWGPEWTGGTKIWKFRAIDASKYAREGFDSKYYYNQISSSELDANKSMIQNYGY